MATAVIKSETGLRDNILDLSRQNLIGELSPVMSKLLDQAIEDGYYPDTDKLKEINHKIILTTSQYREQTGVSTVVLGMSGGVDSALTAAIFKAAGYRVVGVTMPIHQEQSETDRGFEACEALGIEHQHIDLSELFDLTVKAQFELDGGIHFDNKSARIRKGNIRARLRMITLYNLASALGGIVASTDNLSELSAGFWTLHGDVGDFSPIQSLLKSWEVPYLARLNGVPESTVRAHPTDGLGVDTGDEAQLGCSYLEWDLMVYALATGLVSRQTNTRCPTCKKVDNSFCSNPFHLPDGSRVINRGSPMAIWEQPEGQDMRMEQVRKAVTSRMGATWYKRKNPINVPHPTEDRYSLVDSIDANMFVPKCLG